MASADGNGQCTDGATGTGDEKRLPEKICSSVEKQVFYGFIIWIHCSLSHQSQTFEKKLNAKNYLKWKKPLCELCWIDMECRSSLDVLAAYVLVLLVLLHTFCSALSTLTNSTIWFHYILLLCGCVQQCAVSLSSTCWSSCVFWSPIHFTCTQNQIAIIIIIMCWRICLTYIFSPCTWAKIHSVKPWKKNVSERETMIIGHCSGYDYYYHF